MFRLLGRNVSLACRGHFALRQSDILSECRLRLLQTSTQVSSFEVNMPSLSPTMEEGNIVKWLKKEGEEFSAGDVLCEIQTDKAVVSLEADDDGKVAQIVKQADSGMIKVGQLIAVMAEPDEDWQEVAKNRAESLKKSPEESSSKQAQVEQSEEKEEESGPTGGSTPGTEVNMPSLSPTMTEGTIVKWYKKEGEKIGAGDILADIQTDKAVVSYEVDDDAIVAKLFFDEGASEIKVGTLIALTVAEDEDWKDVQIPAVKKSSKKIEQQQQQTPQKSQEDTTTGLSSQNHKFENLSRTGPASIFLLAQYGIKSSEVKPSGPKGLVKSDVWKFIEDNQLKPIKVSLTEDTSTSKKGTTTKTTTSSTKATTAQKSRFGYTDHPLSSMRSTIAKRLTESKQTSPHGYATVSTNIEALLRLRKAFATRGAAISLNDFIIKAVATTLEHVPEMNLNVSGEDFKIMPTIDISVAVATESGLITPIVKNVPNKSIQEISKEIKDLAGRAREGKLKLDEFQGGTFTISNLGMFGISEFTAIINPPQVGIMAIGTGVQELDPDTGKTVTVMKTTLSFDRRFVDEALANDFMHTFQTVIQEPEFMNIGLERIVRKNRTASQFQ